MNVRPTTFDDGAAIQPILERNGMDSRDPVLWREGWTTYPFAEDFRDIPIGWVLEDGDGSLVGTLANIQMLYDFGGRRLKGVIAADWAVNPEHRNMALKLMSVFFRQKGVDLWINGSASATTSQLLAGLKIPRIPAPGYDIPCFWPVRRSAFAKAALTRRSVPGAALLAYPAGVALLVSDILRGSGRGPLSSSVQRLTQFDERFDDLWKAIITGPPRLRAIRTKAALEWRFRSELRQGRAAIITAGKGDRISGYAVLTRRAGSDLGMDLYDVADLQAAGDEPVIFRDLLLGAIRTAREDGLDAVKFMTGCPAKRAPAAGLRPYTYHLPFWQLYYKTTPEFTAPLSSAEAWDFSLVDTY